MTSDVHAAIEARLRDTGQRYTTKRRQLVEALRRAGRPAATPELVGSGARLPQSSVYRNLAVLEEAGAVRRVVTDEGVARYELAEDLTVHHHHLVCRVCGAVEDVTIPTRHERAIERALADAARRSGFEAVAHRVDLLGTCRRCRHRSSGVVTPTA